MILLTPIPSRAYDSAYDRDFWFSQSHKRSYDSAYDCDCDSVASENQLLRDSAYDSDSDSIASENQPMEGVPFPFYLSLFHLPLLFPPLFFSPAKEAKNADNYDNTNEKKEGARKIFGKYMKTIYTGRIFNTELSKFSSVKTWMKLYAVLIDCFNRVCEYTVYIFKSFHSYSNI